jgi:hypothetical protein
MPITPMDWFALAPAVVAGFAFGLGYFRLLRRQSSDFLAGGSLPRGFAMALLRVAVAAVAFWLASRLGPAFLLCAFAGFLAARFVVVSRLRRMS